ncbi:hypothetical protein K469DRAFT_712320 [Zopfia rhizophila CBS 207.26]|uniref:Uncharacterized protein n=1 Tax=Zopfia rhizophila CBS 207.26 TaxID=1314779 RepID=A0A6A6ETX1_9PEZI|nr:hypothetical protein K469DRAFT_712320 [Zopfia rhizophila CBS 207.26]
MERAKECILKIEKEDRELVEDFIQTGERFWISFAKLVKVWGDDILETAKRESGHNKPVTMARIAGASSSTQSSDVIGS